MRIMAWAAVLIILPIFKSSFFIGCSSFKPPPDLTPNPSAVDNRSAADILATRRAVNAANDPDYATVTPGEITTLAATTPERKLTKVQMTATVETERKIYTAGRLTEQVASAEEKGCLLRDCINYIEGLCAKARSGYKHYAPDTYASCRPGGTLYGYMGNVDGQLAQGRAVIRMTAVAYHPQTPSLRVEDEQPERRCPQPALP